MKKHVLVVGIVFLFVFSSVPITFGFNVRTSNEEQIVKSLNFDSYHISEITSYGPIDEYKEQSDNVKSKDIESITATTQSLDGPMDSAWPMYCHDVRHTGRSPYSTADNPGLVKWLHLFLPYSMLRAGIAIGDDGTIYFGGYDFFAMNPDGTLKWTYKDIVGWIHDCCPAIGEDGTIYVGDESGVFHAINPVGTRKWIYDTYALGIYASPVISDDGMIYFSTNDGWDGSWSGSIYALNPNGTLKWRVKTGHVTYSSPTIGDDGTVYCGSHDTYLYALYPNNGTLKWKYKTGNWIRTSPCIGDDGTIYCVSLDSYLHAVYPNGTMKWKINVGGGTSPTIGQDGTIYCGYNELHAVHPDGYVKWELPVHGPIRGGTPCNSADGTIYLGTSDGAGIIAVNPNGTEKWRKWIGVCESPPAIAEDGTIYIGGEVNVEIRPGAFQTTSYLYAFNDLDPNAPSAPEINGSTIGNYKLSHRYTFNSTSPLRKDVYYWIDWGDTQFKDMIGPYPSGKEISESHKWYYPGEYTIKARAFDEDDLWGPESTYTVIMQRSRVII